jgi:hypothetical protein
MESVRPVRLALITLKGPCASPNQAVSGILRVAVRTKPGPTNRSAAAWWFARKKAGVWRAPDNLRFALRMPAEELGALRQDAITGERTVADYFLKAFAEGSKFGTIGRGRA